MHRFVSLVFSLLATWTTATSFEKIAEPPPGWVVDRPAAPNDVLNLQVGLRLPEDDVRFFEQKLISISSPDHFSYGQHLEKHEIEQMLKPSEAGREQVLAWLRGSSTVFDEGDFIHFRTNVHNASQLLGGAEFAWYKNPDIKGSRLRTLAYGIPSDVAEYVSFVDPTIKFPSIRPLRSTISDVTFLSDEEDASINVNSAQDATTSTCNDARITPQCLLNLYNVHYGASATNGNRLSFASFLGESARYTDLAKFEDLVAPYAKGQNFSVELFSGAKNDQTSRKDSMEGSLDAQYLTGLGSPTPVTEFITAGCGPLMPDADEHAGECDNEPYIRFLTALLKKPNRELPQVLSISYGEDETAWPKPLAQKVCNMIAQLGARGTTVITGSGDLGPGQTCYNIRTKKPQYIPNFPGSCPFITTVGGTRHTQPEKALYFGGGGFSDYFTRPTYQQGAVSRYLKMPQVKSDPFSTYYNHSGRAYPDVSAQSYNFAIIDKGRRGLIAGTSASAPVFAAIVSLLNSARISCGKKPLGFVNPLLYSDAVSKTFTDITAGGSIGCYTKNDKATPGAGFNATEGWDPVTGLGTPDFGKLLALVAPGVKNTGGPVPP